MRMNGKGSVKEQQLRRTVEELSQDPYTGVFFMVLYKSGKQTRFSTTLTFILIRLRKGVSIDDKVET